MNIETYVKRKAELNEALRANAQDMIKQLFAEFFAAAPDVKCVAWTQYAPYFNDGEPCTFSVHEPNFFTRTPAEAEAADEVLELGDSEINTFEWRDGHDPVRPEIKAFIKRFEIASDLFETLSEDAQVIVTNVDGKIDIAVDSCDHD